MTASFDGCSVGGAAGVREESVSFAFAATYDGPWTFPETAAGKKDMAMFFIRPEVVSGKNAEGWKRSKCVFASGMDVLLHVVANSEDFWGDKPQTNVVFGMSSEGLGRLLDV